MIQGTSSYETNSGTLPQQEHLKFQQDKVFTLGTITIPTEFKNYKNLKWLHLSIRQSTLGVPNRVYIKTHQTKFSINYFKSQSVAKRNGFKKFSSFFYNQTSFIIDRKQKKVATLN
jgi:hypothetical protein